MVPVPNKVFFLNTLLQRGYVKEKHTASFFAKLTQHKEIIERLHFVNNGEQSYDYLITLNLHTNKPFIWVKGKMYKDAHLLRSIFELMRRTDIEVFLLIETKKHGLKNELSKLNYNDKLVQHLLFEACMDYTVNDYHRTQLMKRIDEALIQRDEVLFMQLTEEYNNI